MFFIGTYALPTEESIFLYKADFEKQEFTRLATHIGTPNPSYLLRNSSGLLYAVEELTPNGNVSAYRVRREGFDKLCTLSANGADPCHLAMDDRERFLFVANYTSGSLTMFALDIAGVPQGICCQVQHEGRGPDAVRQEGPHVHFSQYINGLLYVCDLGLDTVFCYHLNAAQKKLEVTNRTFRLPAGNGPRHLCFHPQSSDWIYVVAELSARVFVYHLERDCFVLKQEISSLPVETPVANRVAAIKLSDDGEYLYVSNRGMDTLTVFAVMEDHLLHFLDICPTGGKAPRDFTPFGDDIIVANQDSSVLTVLRFDRDQQRLAPLNMRATVGYPVCILKTDTVPIR
jgi:6-phosphogluconolactonase